MPAVTQVKGDLFDAPSGSVFVHSCNCQGSWGAGIALALKNRYPAAYESYARHCRGAEPADLLGTCLLVEADEAEIACLFTSARYGRAKDPPKTILEHTRAAVKDMLQQVHERDGTSKQNTQFAAVKLNAGAFAVPWPDTKAILEELFSASDRKLTVYDR